MYTRDLIERVAGENMYTNGILSSIRVSTGRTACLSLVASRVFTPSDVFLVSVAQSYQEYLASEMKLAFPELSSPIDDLGILRQTNGDGNV